MADAGNQIVHTKYRTQGAYHWASIGRNPLKYNCFTAARYRTALDLAGGLEGKRVLDFGCGDGAFVSLAHARGASCTGLEPDDEGRRLAKSEFAKRSLPIDVAASVDELKPESFDVVFLLEVIEHVADPAGLLQTLKSLLRPGGTLILTTPVRLTETPLDPEHVKEYFPTELDALVGGVFSVEERVEKIPVAAVEIYLAAPRFTLRLPIVRYLMNLVAILTGRNPIFGIGTYRRYHTLLGLRARK